VSNGHDFIDTINLGAKTIVCDVYPENLEKKVTYVKVADTNEALAFMAANYYKSIRNLN
jgi:UDP-N-acetylmuramoyl-L-alanyl-D-glutamate--2,6-diaminopimelate ligase